MSSIKFVNLQNTLQSCTSSSEIGAEQTASEFHQSLEAKKLGRANSTGVQIGNHGSALKMPDLIIGTIYSLAFRHPTHFLDLLQNAQFKIRRIWAPLLLAIYLPRPARQSPLEQQVLRWCLGALGLTKQHLLIARCHHYELQARGEADSI
jgi:hypothetical protein